MQYFGAVLLAASAAHAHYTFPRLVVNGVSEPSDWWATRQTKNANSKTGVLDVNSADIRCYTSTTAANVLTVPAGSTLHYIASQQVNHPGPTDYYLAKVPSGSSAKSWDGSGAVWFKISDTKPYLDANKQMLWPDQNQYYLPNTTIPTATPSGDYLLRVDQIALHQAQNVGGAQIYVACTQITITGGGSGTPGPLVAFPGAYKATDKGILVNLYSYASAPQNYTPPGPVAWTG